MRDVDEMIERLLDMDIVKADNTVVFSNEARQLIHEIAEKCSTIPIVDETREQAEEYARGLSAEQVYTDMLQDCGGAYQDPHEGVGKDADSDY